MSINANKRSLDDANAEFFSDEWFAANADEIDDILKQAEKKPRMMVQTRCEVGKHIWNFVFIFHCRFKLFLVGRRAQIALL